jgi:hypothetical protein
MFIGMTGGNEFLTGYRRWRSESNTQPWGKKGSFRWVVFELRQRLRSGLKALEDSPRSLPVIISEDCKYPKRVIIEAIMD